jgi:hypothetical protein
VLCITSAVYALTANILDQVYNSYLWKLMHLMWPAGDTLNVVRPCDELVLLGAVFTGCTRSMMLQTCCCYLLLQFCGLGTFTKPHNNASFVGCSLQGAAAARVLRQAVGICWTVLRPQLPQPWTLGVNHIQAGPAQQQVKVTHRCAACVPSSTSPPTHTG